MTGALKVPLGRLVAARCAAFPLRLVRDGRVVIEGSCFIYAIQFANATVVESAIGRTRLWLPAGRWRVESEYKDQTGGSGDLASPDGLAIRAARVLTVPARKPPYGGSTSPGRFPARLACGLTVSRYLPFPLEKPPSFYAYATVSWPSMSLIGTNAPIDPGERGGGLNPYPTYPPGDPQGLIVDWHPDHLIDQRHTCRATRLLLAIVGRTPNPNVPPNERQALHRYEARIC
jgi:hypothetical protein